MFADENPENKISFNSSNNLQSKEPGRWSDVNYLDHYFTF